MIVSGNAATTREVIASANDSSLVDNAARGTIHDAVRAASRLQSVMRRVRHPRTNHRHAHGCAMSAVI